VVGGVELHEGAGDARECDGPVAQRGGEGTGPVGRVMTEGVVGVDQDLALLRVGGYGSAVDPEVGLAAQVQVEVRDAQLAGAKRQRDPAVQRLGADLAVVRGRLQYRRPGDCAQRSRYLSLPRSTSHCTGQHIPADQHRLVR